MGHWAVRRRASHEASHLRLGVIAAGLAMLTALALSDRRLTAHLVRWAQEHWFNAAAITAAATIATVVVPFAIRRLDRRSGEQPGAQAGPCADHLARDRAVMLRRVRRDWIDGILRPSLDNAPPLTTSQQKRPDLCGSTEIRHPRHRQPVPDGKPITTVFDEDAGGELLITGEPGSGKTTVLLELADALLRRAEHDASQPIPVVADLADWSSRRQPLEAWLAEEITTRYHMPRRTAAAWLAQGSLALLLDGFDEVPGPDREGCVQALNIYRREHGTVPIAVSSRTHEIEHLPVRIDLGQAVELQPLTGPQISDYLGGLAPAGTATEDFLFALTDNDVALLELLRSPLMLHVFGSAYRAAKPLIAGSVQEQRQQLWAAYLTQMFRERPLGPRCGYTANQAERWLTWLALQMRNQVQPTFYLDRLPARWIPPASLLAHGRAGERLLKLLTPSDGSDPQPAETLHWSWKALGSIVLRSLGVGLIAGPAWALAWLSGLSGPLTELLQVWKGGALSVILLAFALIWVLDPGSGRSQILTGGLRHQRVSPNQGVQSSGSHALLVGLGYSLPPGMATGLLFGTGHAQRLAHTIQGGPVINVPAFGATLGLIAFLAVGVPMALIYGGDAWLQHYRVRAALVIAGAAPWDYEAFLEAMTQRLLLRRVGSGYIFMHQMLRDYLAEDVISGKSPAQHTAVR